MHHKCPKDPAASSAISRPAGLVASHKLTKITIKDHHHVDDDLESEPPPTPSSYASPPDEDDEDLEEEEDLVMPLIKQQQQQQLKAMSQQGGNRGRKPRETRRVIRPNDFKATSGGNLVVGHLNGGGGGNVPPQPEQTEPEDLSTSSRMRHASTFSVGSTGGWSAAGSVSIDLNSDRDDDDDDDVDGLLAIEDHHMDEDDDDDNLSDTADLIHRQRKKRRNALDLVHARETQVAK